MDKVDVLYKKYDVLASAGDKISEHEADYLVILESVKGSPSEKRLASQFIARFFKSFPHLSEKAIDAQLDLCEDADVAIRKQAIKDLPSFCKDSKEYVPKIADVLAQLLLTEDHTELVVIQHSLVTLVKLDARGTLGGVFSQVMAGEELVRERAIKFLCTKLPSMGADVLTKEVEEFLFQECCKVMQDVTGQEFTSLMQLLSGLKLSKTIPGQQALVDLAAEQADLGKPLGEAPGAGDGTSQAEALAKLVQCVRQALPYFSPYVSSSKFVTHLCQHALPGQPLLKAETLELLKQLAEMVPFAANLSAEDLEACLKLVFEKLLELMPLPPAGEESENSSQPRPEPELQLSHVECLMYSFHQLAKRNPQFLASEESAERLRDFKLRLQYLARGLQVYIKKLRLALQGKKPSELKTEENKLKAAALKTTSNINALIRDLFHVPPSFKSSITLSWKPVPTNEKIGAENSQTVQAAGAKGEKRRISYPEDTNKGTKRVFAPSKNERELYSPPSGKYSTKVQGFQLPANRGRGGFNRFRGGGRGWRGRIYS
ncbi:apoptosis inhibitor cassowary [Rhipicephalus microplus]|uniref:apoptosis inhibitor cassowary n=1 Tax=Rhipicephalus microplus TaxID=6941 RepID=UPI0018882247|nr:apoptosis inhibitor 5-like [Rhipicephalus microplus]